MKSPYIPQSHTFSEKQIEEIYNQAKLNGFPTTENSAIFYIKNICWGYLYKSDRWHIRNLYSCDIEYQDYLKLKNDLESGKLKEIEI